MTENQHDLPPQLASYLQVQDNKRTRRVETFLASLTPRERSLVHDAAVMGYMQGTYHERHKPIPKDSVIMRQVVAECQAFPDLYPVIGGRVDQYLYAPAEPETEPEPKPEPEPGTGS